MMRSRRAQIGLNGFTLVEVLAALAIASVIITSTAALVGNVALYFDRGTRGVGEAERLVLALDRLAGDFGSARFILRLTETGEVTTFTGEQANDEQPAKVVFVGAGRVGPASRTEEVISLTVEEAGDVSRLVRRSATWLGPRVDEPTPQNAVVLVEGKYDMAFAFGRINGDGSLSWQENWTGQSGLPRFVRLKLRDRATGSDLLVGAEFVVRADAPEACAQADATASCLAASPAGPAPSPELEFRRPSR
jgi:prepilin-type N-terminal cleavage/methylation domain-containing protein